MPRKPVYARVDPDGRLVLPPETAARLGFAPGARVPLEEDEHGLRLARPVSHLARIYVEPTNTCNLDCRTCMRNVWSEPSGMMSGATFERVLAGAAAISPTPLIFFGGFGEPLAHPAILDMVRRAKNLGGEVELITNGTLLDGNAARGLLEAGLDGLWVSLDGAHPESYSDVRLGAELPRVLENLARLRDLQTPTQSLRLGIAFVAMRRNLGDLPDLLCLGAELGASRYSISNVLAHTPELREQSLYRRAVDQGERQNNPRAAQVDLPRTDMDPAFLPSLQALLEGNFAISLAGKSLAEAVNRCPFVEKGSLSIRWDGTVSPCLALLHDHVAYLGERVRKSHAFAAGNIHEKTISAIWHDPQYVDLRERLLAFDFSPCAFCNSCEMSVENLEDCFGSLAPACGGCLWAQGIIRCP